MGCATGQTPDQPGVHITKAQLTHLCTLACSRYVVKDPLDLGAAEVSIDNQSGLLTNFVDEALSFQLVAVLCGTAILPYNGIVNGFFCIYIPNDGGLTLIGDTNSGNVQTVDIDSRDSLGDDRSLGRPDLIRIVLHPSWFGEVLCKLFLCY